VAIDHAVFQCVVIAPQGTLLNCTATSVVFPAHDGYAGVWHGHMPMLCKLGLGIMEVKYQAPQRPLGQDQAFLLIDGGFALNSSNVLTIIAPEAISLENVPAEKVEQMLEKSRKKLSSAVYTPQQRQDETRKLSLLTRLAQLSVAAKH